MIKKKVTKTDVAMKFSPSRKAKVNRKKSIELAGKIRKLIYSKKYRNLPLLVMNNLEVGFIKPSNDTHFLTFSKLDALTVNDNTFDLSKIKLK